MSPPSRRSLVATLASMAGVGLAGCSSTEPGPRDGESPKTPTRTPDQETPSPPYQLTLVNDTGQGVDASIEVQRQTLEEPVWAGSYQLTDGAKRDVEVEIEPGEYVLRCWMPDGPVETLFGHEWHTAEEPSLRVGLHDGGVEFEGET